MGSILYIISVESVAGALIGYRMAGWPGALGGGIAGMGVQWAFEPVDTLLGLVPASPWSVPGLDHAADDYTGIRVGTQVIRPDLSAAVLVLRPTLGIYREFEPRGDRPYMKLTVAGLVNAYAESRFDQMAGGDVVSGIPQAIGLYQLNSNGAGAGMTVKTRTDPLVATRRILEVASAKGLVKAAESNSTIESLIRGWCVYVESPKDAEAKAKERINLWKTDTYLQGVLAGCGLPIAELPVAAPKTLHAAA